MEGLKIALLFLGSFLVGMLTRGIVRDDIGGEVGKTELVHLSAGDVTANSAGSYQFETYEEIPTIAVRTYPDDQGGMTVQIKATNFNFDPESIDADMGPYYGYAQIVINGETLGRAYGQRVYVSSDQLKPGINVIMVTLMSTTHQELLGSDGSAIAEKIFLTVP